MLTVFLYLEQDHWGPTQRARNLTTRQPTKGVADGVQDWSCMIKPRTSPWEHTIVFLLLLRSTFETL